MAMLGMFNMSTGLVEGSDDPGRVYSKKPELAVNIERLEFDSVEGMQQ